MKADITYRTLELEAYGDLSPVLTQAGFTFDSKDECWNCEIILDNELVVYVKALIRLFGDIGVTTLFLIYAGAFIRGQHKELTPDEVTEAFDTLMEVLGEVELP